MRRTTLIFLGVSLSFMITSFSFSDETCDQSLLMSLKEKDPRFITEFFQLQTKLTLNRLAWAYLNKVGASEKLNSQNKFEVEKLIEGVLDQFDGKNSQKFLGDFLKHPYSRKSLTDVFSDLKPLIEEQNDEFSKTNKYKIHAEDISMIALLSEVEPSSRFTMKDSKMQSSSILNLLKLVKSAYHGKNLAQLKDEKLFVETQLKKNETEMNTKFQFLNQIKKDLTECKSDAENCTDCNQSHFMELLKGELVESKYKGLHYGDIWLRTRYKAISEKEINLKKIAQKQNDPLKNKKTLEELLTGERVPLKAERFKFHPLFGFKESEEMFHKIPEEYRKKDKIELLNKRIDFMNEHQDCFKQLNLFSSQMDYKNRIQAYLVNVLMDENESDGQAPRSYGHSSELKECQKSEDLLKTTQFLIESQIRKRELKKKCKDFSELDLAFLSVNSKTRSNLLLNSQCKIGETEKDRLKIFNLLKNVLQ